MRSIQLMLWPLLCSEEAKAVSKCEGSLNPKLIFSVTRPLTPVGARNVRSEFLERL